MSRWLLWSLALMLLAGACAAPPTLPAPPTPAPLALAATDTAAPLVRRLLAVYRADAPGVLPALSVVPQLSLAAELATGRAALAFTAQPLAGQFAAPVGELAVRLAVHPALTAPALTSAQARAVLAGEITDWAQLGGAPQAVQVAIRVGGDLTPALTARLGAFTPPATALTAPTWAALRALLGATPGAVGYLPETELDASVQTAPLAEPLTVTIAAVALAEPAGLARDFLAWAQSAAGQAALEK